jgi:endonuclease/exonuclease/phosphatase family metal-dependent hydrolase
VRFVTLNLWGERGPFERRMPLVVSGLRALGADVVALQEVREIPGRVPNMAETIAGELGMRCEWAPAMEWGGGTEGVAILTATPLRDVVRLDLPHGSEKLRRVALCGRASTPRGEARVCTAHLHYRLEHGREREDQAVALASLLAARPDEVAVLLGDLNATPDSDEIRFLRGKTTLGGNRAFFQDAWELHHPGEAGHTWARENPCTADLRWLQPGRRIDYVLVSKEEPDGRGEVLSCDIVLDRATDGVFPSDHWGLCADVRVRAR